MVARIDGATACGGGVRQRRLLVASEELRRVWQRPTGVEAVCGGGQRDGWPSMSDTDGDTRGTTEEWSFGSAT
jgi:hypothetical protein